MPPFGAKGTQTWIIPSDIVYESRQGVLDRIDIFAEHRRTSMSFECIAQDL